MILSPGRQSAPEKLPGHSAHGYSVTGKGRSGADVLVLLLGGAPETYLEMPALVVPASDLSGG